MLRSRMLVLEHDLIDVDRDELRRRREEVIKRKKESQRYASRGDEVHGGMIERLWSTVQILQLQLKETAL